ncbi:MAG: folate-binding protein [Synechococcus sp.]|nr:folate-binding protein [Synechococcus sp.]
MGPSSRTPSPESAGQPHDSTALADPWNWQPQPPGLAAWPVTLLQLRGVDSLRFLHGQTSQAIAQALPGQWLSTCCISPTARLRALAEVLVNDDGAWLVISAGDGAAVHQALDRVLFPADAVTLGPLRCGLLLQPLPQPQPAPLLAAAGERWRPLPGGEGFWLGERLLLLDAAAGERDPLPLDPAARGLLARRRLSGEEQERWRLQLGLPIGPLELCEDTNPFELGLAARVSLAKGCYVGQETLAKLATYDGVRRQLRRWWAPGDGSLAAALAPGTRLLGPDGERAGRITSSLQLPDEGVWIGLALVRRQALTQATLWSGGPGAAAAEPAAASSPTATEPSPQPAAAAAAIACGASSQGLALQISRPPAWVDPPLGAGGLAGGGS